MVLGRLRSKYEELTLPIGRALAELGITPNQMTLFSLAVSGLALYLYWKVNLLAGVLGVLLVGIVDMLDGSIARATGKITRFGGVLDHVIDRYAEFMIFMGLMLNGIMHPYIVYNAVFAMLMASYTRAKAESIGGLKSCRVGLAERQEKLLTLIAGSLIAFFWKEYQTLIMNITGIVICVISHITVVQRLLYTRRHAK